MLPGPSSVLRELLRNVGIFAFSVSGGVTLYVWRYEIQTGQPEEVPISAVGLSSDFRDHRYTADITVAFHTDCSWRVHRPLPPPFREVVHPFDITENRDSI
jgi:hypothetical protein